MSSLLACSVYPFILSSNTVDIDTENLEHEAKNDTGKSTKKKKAKGRRKSA